MLQIFEILINGRFHMNIPAVFFFTRFATALGESFQFTTRMKGGGSSKRGCYYWGTQRTTVVGGVMDYWTILGNVKGREAVAGARERWGFIIVSSRG